MAARGRAGPAHLTRFLRPTDLQIGGWQAPASWNAEGRGVIDAAFVCEFQQRIYRKGVRARAAPLGGG
nr:hypothetical protein JVH1_0084 [Rhodococcus sp. JVH1]